MRADVTTTGITVTMNRLEASAMFFMLTELGARTDEDPGVRDVWSFFELVHQVPVEGQVDSGPIRSRVRKK